MPESCTWLAAGMSLVMVQGASVSTGTSCPSTIRDSRQFCLCRITPDLASESSGTLDLEIETQ